jgi:hypothetical protein
VQPTRGSCCLIGVTGGVRPHPRVWLGVALTGSLVAACGVAGPESRTFVGPVTVVGASGVCVGGPEASGECFVRDRLTRDLHVSDCVRVTYVVHDSPGRSTATKVERLDPSKHADACPRQ